MEPKLLKIPGWLMRDWTIPSSCYLRPLSVASLLWVFPTLLQDPKQSLHYSKIQSSAYSIQSNAYITPRSTTLLKDPEQCLHYSKIHYITQRSRAVPTLLKDLLHYSKIQSSAYITPRSKAVPILLLLADQKPRPAYIDGNLIVMFS